MRYTMAGEGRKGRRIELTKRHMSSTRLVETLTKIHDVVPADSAVLDDDV